MSISPYIIIAFIAAALIAILLTEWLLRLCHRFSIYDQPSMRKIHKTGIPRLGGVVFVPATAIGMLAAFSIMELRGGDVPETIKLSSLLLGGGAVLIYLIGLIDDLIDCSASLKFFIQMAVTMVFPLCGLYFDSFYGFLGINEIPLLLSYPLTIFISLLIINAINLIDGIDGLAAMTSIIAVTAYGILFGIQGKETFPILSAALCGSLAAFLLYNFFGKSTSGTKIFMGDSGSLLLGVILAYYTIKYAMLKSPLMEERADGLLMAWSIMLVPCLDLCRVALCRLKRGQGIFEADRTHFHHKLLSAGFTMTQALIAIIGVQLFMLAMNVVLFHMGLRMEWIVLIDVLMFTGIHCVLPIEQHVSQKKHAYGYHDGSVMPPEMDFQGEDSLVSVIMPTYNAAQFVAESIESIMAQTYQNWELIITDDCSTDDTMDILRRYASADPRIRIQQNVQNSGAGYSRNASIAQARGRYIAYCDSDDRWMPRKLELQLQFMQEHNTGICFAPYYTCNEFSEYLGYIPAPNHVNLFSTMCDDKIGFLTCIYDARQCGKHYMPLQRKRQDYAFVLNLMRTCPHAYSVSEPLAHYRLHSNNISGKKLSLLKYNAQTYTVVFGWPKPLSYAFLFSVFLPCYFWKRTKNMIINIYRAA